MTAVVWQTGKNHTLQTKYVSFTTCEHIDAILFTFFPLIAHFRHIHLDSKYGNIIGFLFKHIQDASFSSPCSMKAVNVNSIGFDEAWERVEPTGNEEIEWNRRCWVLSEVKEDRRYISVHRIYGWCAYTRIEVCGVNVIVRALTMKRRIWMCTGEMVEQTFFLAQRGLVLIVGFPRFVSNKIAIMKKEKHSYYASSPAGKTTQSIIIVSVLPICTMAS